MSGQKFNSKTKKFQNKAESKKNSPEWKGVSLVEIFGGKDRYDYQELPPIRTSSRHKVLFALPIPDLEPPKPYPPKAEDEWNQDFVKMPHSPNNICPIKTNGKKKEFCNRWEVIREALLQNIMSSEELETAILSYNPEQAKKWKFSVMHLFFNEAIDKEESEQFFKILLPKIIDLALQLPTLITGSIPLLKSHTNVSISFSQLQVASLLANAFLCTFPRHPQSEYQNFNQINFEKLFSTLRDNKRNSMMEKFKFFIHYFRRVTTKLPKGTITVQRRNIRNEDFPRWKEQSQKLPLLHITSKGTIETEGAGLLQVDFADKYVGGKILSWGCVQEEILFLLYPELLVTSLVSEVLGDTEALIISGVERYSQYEGYSNSLKYAGDFIDHTPRDESGRRKSSFVAIDATFFKSPSTQFKINNVLRELNKAYVGFNGDISIMENMPAVATGNWGCGIFKGDPKLKVLLQMMAAGVSRRSVVYFTFRNEKLRDSISQMYSHLVQHDVDIGQLFSLLSEYSELLEAKKRQDLYSFLYQKIK